LSNIFKNETHFANSFEFRKSYGFGLIIIGYTVTNFLSLSLKNVISENKNNIVKDKCPKKTVLNSTQHKFEK